MTCIAFNVHLDAQKNPVNGLIMISGSAFFSAVRISELIKFPIHYVVRISSIYYKQVCTREFAHIIKYKGFQIKRRFCSSTVVSYRSGLMD